MDLREELGPIDIYLLDQLMKGRLRRGMRILDAGCGTGRNLVYMLRNGFDVHATDSDPKALDQARRLAAALAPDLPAENFRNDALEKLSFASESFDAVLSIAVLHFARDPQHFEAMLSELWRVLRPGGIFFCRLATDIGLPEKPQSLGNGQFLLRDGSTRFLVTEKQLMESTDLLGGRWLEPLKTTNVQNLRCMTTWVITKGSGA